MNIFARSKDEADKRIRYQQLVSELSEIDPRELSAILGICQNDIKAYARRSIYGS